MSLRSLLKVALKAVIILSIEGTHYPNMTCSMKIKKEQKKGKTEYINKQSTTKNTDFLK